MSEQERVKLMSEIVSVLERLQSLQFVTPRKKDLTTRLEWSLDHHAQQLYKGRDL